MKQLLQNVYGGKLEILATLTSLKESYCDHSYCYMVYLLCYLRCLRSYCSFLLLGSNLQHSRKLRTLDALQAGVAAVKAIIYNNEIYLRCVPAKTLFHSSLVHQVVNRGDVFVLRLSDQVLTIIPGKAQVSFIDIEVNEVAAPKTCLVKQMQQSKADSLRAYRESLNQTLKPKQGELPL